MFFSLKTSIFILLALIINILISIILSVEKPRPGGGRERGRGEGITLTFACYIGSLATIFGISKKMPVNVAIIPRLYIVDKHKQPNC